MKKSKHSSFLKSGLMVSTFIFFGLVANGQDKPKIDSSIPDSVNVIVSASCTPCHTSEGGLMARSKLNLSVWSTYSPEKQKEKAVRMYTQVDSAKMPPEKAREKNPELIPTAKQLAVIRRWSESLPAGSK
jgi:hypothetical protein